MVAAQVVPNLRVGRTFFPSSSGFVRHITWGVTGVLQEIYVGRIRTRRRDRAADRYVTFIMLRNPMVAEVRIMEFLRLVCAHPLEATLIYLRLIERYEK